ncbi:uncharacterized [Tachysurus ichikawai]
MTSLSGATQKLRVGVPVSGQWRKDVAPGAPAETFYKEYQEMRTARRHRENGLAQELHPRPSLSDRRLMTKMVLAPLAPSQL